MAVASMSPGRTEFFMASQPPSMVTTTTFDRFLSADFNAVTAPCAAGSLTA